MWKSGPERQYPGATPFVSDSAGSTALSPLPAAGRSDGVSWGCLLALKPWEGSLEATSWFFSLHLRSPLEFRLIGNDQKEQPSTAQLWAGCFLSPRPLTAPTPFPYPTCSQVASLGLSICQALFPLAVGKASPPAETPLPVRDPGAVSSWPP